MTGGRQSYFFFLFFALVKLCQHSAVIAGERGPTRGVRPAFRALAPSLPVRKYYSARRRHFPLDAP